MNRWIARRTWTMSVPVAALLGVAGQAGAQMIEEVELRADGGHAVFAVRFSTPIRFVRAVPARSRDLVQAFYEVTPTRDPISPVDGQRRILQGAGVLPTVTITDERDQGPQSRKLVIRLDAAARFNVRAGKTNRVIEFVLEGMGSAVRGGVDRPVAPAPASTAPLRTQPQPAQALATTPGQKRFGIVLQRSASPIRMEQPLPRSLADLELSNVARVVQGRTEYELSIGPFATQDEARAALRYLQAFPAATIVELRPAASPATGATEATGLASSQPPSVPIGEQDGKGRELLAQSRAALARGDRPGALAALDELLGLPPTTSTREAQALIGEVRQQMGDNIRARAEFETFLKLYPEGADSQRVRERLAALPAPVPDRPAPAKPTSTATWSGSWSQTYYGGQSQTQTLLKDTPLEGQIPQVVSDSTISGTDQKQLLSSVDVGWRYRDADRDIRFSFRDSFTADFMPNRADKNKMTALYVDYRVISSGLSARLGRQSGLGGGVLGRFDGALFGWAFKPKWKLNAVLGKPTDKLLDAKRHFYGLSVDAEALLPQIGGSFYAIEQKIDGHTDRRAIGNELRYVKPNATVFTVLEYDVSLKGLNVASAQGLFMTEANSSFNVMYDRRSTPLLMLGNALFFTPPGGELPRRISDLLGLQTLEAARRYVVSTTAYMTQASGSFTTPITPRWQVGMDLRLTNVGALAPVADIPELVNGRAGTGNLWTLGGQAIATNLYSSRDTHVFMFSAVSGPSLSGWLSSYNNMSVVNERWQLEPSLRLYQQRQQTASGTIRTSRITPGLRVSYKLGPRWSIESDLSVEMSRSRGTLQDESSTRVYYSLGYRYDY